MNIQQERELARARHSTHISSADSQPRAGQDLPAADAFAREMNRHACLTLGSARYTEEGRQAEQQSPWEFAAHRTGTTYVRPAARQHGPHLTVAGYSINCLLAFDEQGMVWQVGAPADHLQGVSR